jgi:hypothetical protein
VANLISSGEIKFSQPELSTVLNLKQIDTLPPLNPGENTQSFFWKSKKATDSLLKKLFEYKIESAPIEKKGEPPY